MNSKKGNETLSKPGKIALIFLTITLIIFFSNLNNQKKEKIFNLKNYTIDELIKSFEKDNFFKGDNSHMAFPENNNFIAIYGRDKIEYMEFLTDLYNEDDIMVDWLHNIYKDKTVIEIKNIYDEAKKIAMDNYDKAPNQNKNISDTLLNGRKIYIPNHSININGDLLNIYIYKAESEMEDSIVIIQVNPQ